MNTRFAPKPHECRYNECPHRLTGSPVRAWVEYLVAEAQWLRFNNNGGVEVIGLVLDPRSWAELRTTITGAELGDAMSDKFHGVPVRVQRLQPGQTRKIILEIVHDARPHTIEYLTADQP